MTVILVVLAVVVVLLVIGFVCLLASRNRLDIALIKMRYRAEDAESARDILRMLVIDFMSDNLPAWRPLTTSSDGKVETYGLQLPMRGVTAFWEIMLLHPRNADPPNLGLRTNKDWVDQSALPAGELLPVWKALSEIHDTSGQEQRVA